MPGRISHLRARWIWAILLAVTAPGCGQEPIATYRVKHANPPRLRIIGALLPRGEETWVLKCMGPADDLQPLTDAVISLMKSMRFLASGDPAITWDMPQGWYVDTPKPGRFATLKPSSAVDFTIIRLGPQDLNANIARWRRQVGLPSVPLSELVKNARDEKTNEGLPFYLVDVTGTGETKKRPEPTAVAKKPVTYSVPASWKSATEKPGIEYAAFETDKVRVTVSPLRGDGGGLLGNVNRWRMQVGLPEIDDAKLRSESASIDVDGQKAVAVDLQGPGGQRIIGVICPRGEQTWFFKMIGPSDAAGSNKATFEIFVKSAKFSGGD